MMTIRTIYILVLAVVWDHVILTILWILPIWAGVYLSSSGLATEILGEEKVARAQGTFAMAGIASNIIGPLLSGIFTDFIGARVDISSAIPIYIASSILCIFATILVILFVKNE